MRILTISLLALGAVSCSYSAAPVISNIRYTALTHSSLRWQFQVSNFSAFVQIKYGVTSGVYPYQSVSYGISPNWSGIPANNGAASLAIGGLAPNTTYYFRMTARPNPDDDTDICESAACGSVEQIVTTPAEPAAMPVTPEPPVTYQPQLPDTTGYNVVPLTVGSNGSCVAASNVPAASVAAGDTLGAIIAKIGYGTILEFPQGAVCKVPPQPISNGAGYLLPDKPLDPQAGGSVDSPNHRWIILRTASPNPADFPPFGSRITPTWATKLAKLVALTPHNLNGQVFDTNGTSAHHWWFQNLEITHTTDPAYVSPDAIDPLPFVELVRITPQFSQSSPPRYIVLDRLYLHGNGFPTRMKYGLSLGGFHQAMIGCYVSQIDYWRLAKWTKTSPAVSNDGAVLNVPAESIRRNINDPDFGMTQPATITLSNAAGYNGTILGLLDSTGLIVQYTNGSATLNCTNCTAVKVASTAAAANQFAWFFGRVVNGRFVLDFAKTQQYESTAHIAGGAFGVQLLDGGRGPYLFDNNFIDGYGLSFYVDAGGSPYSNDDVTWVRNHQFWNQDHRPTSPTWNGYRYDVRQLWETKRGKRYLLKGNILEGNWSFQNSGPSIFVSGRPSYTLADTSVGISDITMTSNVIRHASSGWTCMGSSTPPPDSISTQRILFENNLLHGINRYIYDDGGPSFASGYTEIFPGCQDVTIRKNTMGLAVGRGPYLFLIGGGAALGGRLHATDNIMYLSVGEGGGGIGVDDNQLMPSHPRLPGVNFSGTVQQKLDTYFVKTGAVVEPNYLFTNNVIIGGVTGTNLSNLRPLTRNEVNAWAIQFPAGNFFPAGNTVAERETNAGLTQTANTNYRLSASSRYLRAAVNGGDIGVSYDTLESELGIVKQIRVVPGSSAVEINYLSPDGKACAVDVAPEGSTVWSRQADGGGERQRQVIFTNLGPNTVHRYRVLCYFEQANGTQIENYPEDQLTSGSFVTETTSTAQQPQQIRLRPPTGAGVVRAILEYGPTKNVTTQSAPLDCGTGCVFDIPWIRSTPFYYRWRYLDSNNVTVAQGKIQGRIAR